MGTVQGIEVIQSSFSAGIDMAAQKIRRCFRIIPADKAVENLQMLQPRIMDFGAVLSGCNDSLGVVIKELAHHLDQISISAVFNEE